SVSGTNRGTVWFDYNNDSQLSEVTFGIHTLLFRYDGESGDLDIGNHGLLEGASIGDINESITHDAFGRVEAYAVEHDRIELYAMSIDERDALGRIAEMTLSRNAGT